MSKVRLLALAALAAATTVSCSERPTAPKGGAQVPTTSLDRGPNTDRAALLTNVPVSGTLADGGSFVGTLTATHISLDTATRTLSMSGVLTGTATTIDGAAKAIVQQFTNIPLTLSHTGSMVGSTGMPTIYQNVQNPSTGTCSILFLDLGPLNLDLLGLQVTLNEVILHLNALAGAGNLLGNLLCAVTNLLDLPAAIAAITTLVNNINTMLAGGTTPGVGGVHWVIPQTIGHVAAPLLSA